MIDTTIQFFLWAQDHAILLAWSAICTFAIAGLAVLVKGALRDPSAFIRALEEDREPGDWR